MRILGIIASGIFESASQTIIFVGSDTVSAVHAYNFSSNTFGTKYANPADIDTSAQSTNSIQSTGNPPSHVFYNKTSSYPRGYLFNNGFGTRIADPITLGTDMGLDLMRKTKYNDGDNKLYISHWGIRAIGTMSFDKTSNTFTSFTNPTYNIGGDGYSVDVGEITTGVFTTVVGHSQTPFISLIRPNMGTRYTNPTSLPQGEVRSVRFYNNIVFFGMNVSPYAGAYVWSETSGWGARYSNPATLPPATIMNYVDVSPNGLHVAYGYSLSSSNTTTNRFICYNFSSGGGFGTKIADPSPVFLNSVYELRYLVSQNSSVLLLGHNNGISGYLYNGSTGAIGTKIADPVVQIVDGGQALSIK